MVDFFIAASNVSETPVAGAVTIALTIPDELEFMDMAQSGWDCIFVARTGFCTTDHAILPHRAAVAGYWTTVLRPMAPGTVAVRFGVVGLATLNVVNNVVTRPADVGAGAADRSHGEPDRTAAGAGTGNVRGDWSPTTARTRPST